MRFALTTFDNPYDPFEQFTQWFMFDEEKGYHTTAYLGRIARTSDQLSDEENNKEVERAIDEIIRYDFQNIYRKITSKSETNEHKEKADEKKLLVTFCAVKSNVLLGWLIGLGNVEVLEPEDVKEKMIALLDKNKDYYK